MPAEDDYDQDLHALAELAEVFLELVATLTRSGAVELDPQRVVELAMDCMPRADAAAIAVWSDGRLRTVAASDPVAEVVEQIRATTGQGPTLDVIETSDVIVAETADHDARWSDFGRRIADETSIHAIATYRLYLGGTQRGALTFYSEWPYAFDRLAVAVGAIFAAYASLVLSHRAVFDGPVPPGRLESVHAEIGVAVGILLAGTDQTVEGAYGQLHAVSRRLRLSLRDAARLVHEHRRPGEPPS